MSKGFSMAIRVVFVIVLVMVVILGLSALVSSQTGALESFGVSKTSIGFPSVFGGN